MNQQLYPRIYTRSKDLPEMDNRQFFHSRQLFEMCEQTKGQKPYMITVETADGKVAAHLLAVVRYRSSWFPPYFYMHCRMLGEGVYEVGYAQTELFELMLSTLKEKMSRRLLYIEISNISQKMFGYKELRRQGFFPVRWMNIYNSLHSKTPEERITEKMFRRITVSYERGTVTKEVETAAEEKALTRLLKQHNFLKPKRFIPHPSFFHKLQQSGNGKLFVTKYKEHVIGCSVCVFSGDNAFLWFTAFRRKSYVRLHPDLLTVWHAIQYAYKNGYQHINFMDVGLPYRKNSYADFILSFGGKPVSTYRWFYFPFGWLNRILSSLYNI